MKKKLILATLAIIVTVSSLFEGPVADVVGTVSKAVAVAVHNNQINIMEE